MSGGVDSSTAAYLLKKQGYDVEGLSLVLFETRKAPTSCCSLESIEAAARVCARLGIPHRTVNAQAEFMEQVMEPFARAYAAGLTPNPCILCNREIKFPFLTRQADERGADFIATGHYAVVDRSVPGKILLKKGADPAKDQSYVLYAQRPEELKRLLLPLGGYHKSEVRQIAAGAVGPAVLNRPESQEICFIEGKDYFPLVRELAPGAGSPGPILNERSEVIGRHRGICAYTVGQRKGLQTSSPGPFYVYRIDAGGNAVYAGGRDKCLISRFTFSGANWITEKRPPFRALVKVRSMMEAVAGQVAEGSAQLVRPVWAPSPGQSAVFYEGEILLGGGIIQEVEIR